MELNECPTCGEGLVDIRDGGGACLECGWSNTGQDVTDRVAYFVEKRMGGN